MKLMQTKAVALSLFLGQCVLLTSCATYQVKVATARDAMRRGAPAQAAQELEPLANKDDRDQLVYLLDYATVLQQAHRYKDSAHQFDRAEKIADIQDYHSISKVTSSLLLSEEMIQYKGDDYEKVLINAVNACNYLELNELDDALVEVRKLNTKLYKFKYEAKRDYEQNPFAYYLSAVIWEADRKFDDAYIAYKSAYDLVPDYAPLKEDLIRAAIRAQRQEDVESWRKKFPEVQIKPEWRDRNMGEIVLVYMQGWGPRKQPRPEEPRFPHLIPVMSEVQSAKLVVDDGKAAAVSSRIFSVQQVAIKTLNDDYARLVATRVAGMATKAVVAHQLAQKNQLLGSLAWVAMNVADRADLRQWSTLPETFQIARLSVKPGKYKVKVVGLDAGGSETLDQMPERDVEVKAGKKAFISWRSVR
jgi:hypothetical protein